MVCFKTIYILESKVIVKILPAILIFKVQCSKVCIVARRGFAFSLDTGTTQLDRYLSGEMKCETLRKSCTRRFLIEIFQRRPMGPVVRLWLVDDNLS